MLYLKKNIFSIFYLYHTSHALVLELLEEDGLVLGDVDQLRLEVLEQLPLRGAHRPEDVEHDGEQEGHHEEQYRVTQVQDQLIEEERPFIVEGVS